MDAPVSIRDFLELARNYGLEHFGLYYGQYRGTVVSNEDPQKMGRVKVRVPQIAGDNKMEYWAFPAGQTAGEDFGDFTIPPKGAPVWVSFECGDPSHPVYTGGHWGKSTLKAPKNGNPKVRTRASEKFNIVMDDDTGVFRIETKNGQNYFEITSDGNINIRGMGVMNVEIGENSSTMVLDGTDVIVSGWPFLQHSHIDVQSGGDVSGPVGGDGGGGGGAGTGGSGSVKAKTEVSDANYTVDPDDDYMIAIKTLTVTRTVTLPDASIAGDKKKYYIKDQSGNASDSVKITVTSPDLIDGVSSIDITVPYGGFEVYSDGTNYFTL